jgi:hypothetical protein
VSAFRNFDTEEPFIAQQGRYSQLWAFWDGSWMKDPALWRLRDTNPSLYADTRQLWRHADAVVSLYQQFVYPGDLSTDGQPLPDGSRGAIPIDPQTGSTTTDQQLLVAFAEWWNITRYKQRKSLRPKFAAILGDCLTELIDDTERGVVYPTTIWPGWVTDIQLDLVGNVTAYTLEYDVEIEESSAYGRFVAADTYRYRKEVNRDGFWHFRDDRLDRFVENPYGFVPAVWDRHEIVWGNRGLGAFEKTMQAALEMNSTLSQAMDFQARKFASPIGVVGSSLSTGRDNAVQIPRPRLRTDQEILLEAETRIAEYMNLLPLSTDGKFLEIEFDIGKTKDLLDFESGNISAENPEARYGQQILEMTQLTAPGVERALGPIKGKLDAARDNHDPQTIKEGQMALAIMGWRLNNGDYDPALVAAREARYEAFRPYDLESYGEGLMDCSIPSREMIPRSDEERVALLILIETLKTDWARERAGIKPEDVAKMRAEAEAQQDRLDAQMTGFRAANNEETDATSPRRVAAREREQPNAA